MKFKNGKGLTLALMRVVIVFVFLWHGIPKAFKPAMAMDKFVGMGFPGFLGPIVGWVEVIGAVLILLGVWFNWANYVLALIMAVAIIGVHLPKGITVGLERDLLILAGTLVLANHGPGICAIRKK